MYQRPEMSLKALLAENGCSTVCFSMAIPATADTMEAHKRIVDVDILIYMSEMKELKCTPLILVE